MFPVELIPELRDHIVSFLGPWDEIASFSLTCRQAVEAVEAYSRRELDRIERAHDVDDTWRFRVGMQAAQDAAERLSSEGEQRQEGLMLVPNNISHRRMLRSAYRTYLYALGMIPSRDWTSLLALSMHPNGKHLLSGSHGRAGDRSVRLWDLSTKQCIKSFIGHESSIDNVGFSAGYVVSSSIDPEPLRIWSMDGVCKYVISLPEEHTARTLALSNDMVYTMDTTGPIYSVNTMAGTVSSMEQPWGDMEAFAYPIDLRVCKNYLLCMRSISYIRDDDDAAGQNGLGIYIFDRDSMDVRGYLVGNYRSMASTSDGDVGFSTFHGQIQVYQLQDGSLVPRLSVSCPGGHIELLCMTKSSVFVKEVSRVRTHSRITVYSSINGTMERTLCYPTVDRATGAQYFPWVMTSNEREAFVGFNVGGGGRRAGGTVKAFLLQ